MLRQKEQKLLLIFSIIIFAVTTAIIIITDISKITILISGMAIFLVYFLAAMLIEHINKRIYNIRISTENIKTNEAEVYAQDELGKLASEIDKLIKLYEDSIDNRLREKEFLRDIISDMSHQIKTPLASLSLFNEIMLEDLQDERFTDMVKQSEVQLERIKWLILSMLQLSKIESKSICFSKAEISISNVISSCIDMLKSTIDSKSITINLPKEDYSILADGEWLKEALINIIKNAIDYSPEESTIDISIEKTPMATTIIIKDNGIGILEKDKLNVFKRFYRSDNTSPKSSSVGIGLSLSKSIIEEMGGKIWIESKHISECIKGESSYTSVHIMF